MYMTEDTTHHAPSSICSLFPERDSFTLVSKSMCKMIGDMYGRSFCLLAGYGPYRIVSTKARCKRHI